MNGGVGWKPGDCGPRFHTRAGRLHGFADGYSTPSTRNHVLAIGTTRGKFKYAKPWDASGAERDNTMRELSARRNRQRRELPAQGRAGASGGREMSHYGDFVAPEGRLRVVVRGLSRRDGVGILSRETPGEAGFGGSIMETSGAFDTLTGTGRALAIAALLATSASPTAADVCSDFRAALALRDVAWRTLIEHIEAGSTDVDAVANAYYEADLAIGIPARAVERAIDDEAATATIEAVRTVRREMNLAFEKVRVWFPTRPRVPAPFLPFYIKMSEADGTLSEAYHEALIAAACR